MNKSGPSIEPWGMPPSPTSLNTSSLQTLSDQVMFKTYLQSPIPQLSSLRTSSFFKVYHSAPYRRVPQMTVYNSLLQAKASALKAFVSSSFFLVNAFSGYSRSNIFFTGSILCNEAPKVVKVRRFLT